MAISSSRTGRKDEARKVYELFLSSAEQNPLMRDALAKLDANRTVKPFIATPMQGVGEALFSLASALSDDQGIDVALVYAQLALSVEGNRDVALTLAWRHLRGHGQLSTARSPLMRRSRRARCCKANAEIEIAVNLQRLEKSAEAKARLGALIAGDPQNYDAIMTLGNVHRNNEEFAEAAEAYSTGDRPDRIADRAATGRPSTIAASPMSASKQWDKAEADFRRR